MNNLIEAPERIWIESEGGCPYFYREEELSAVISPVTEYVRADKLEELTAALASERTAHAETRWARDEAFQKFVDANEARIDAKTRLAQALKALKQIEQQLDYGQVDTALHITRRALEGGE